MNHLLRHWQDILGAVGGIVFLVFRSWLVGKVAAIAEKLTVRIEQRLVKSERDFVLWTHYRFRAERVGHQPKKPVDCSDGHCVEITK